MTRSGTSQQLTHGEELLAGLLATQAKTLQHIRTLLAILVLLAVVGAVIGVVATQSGS